MGILVNWICFVSTLLNYLHHDLITCTLIVKCKDLHYYHQCAHRLIKTSLDQVIYSNENFFDADHRSDNFLIDVYNIQLNRSVSKSLIVLFEIDILSECFLIQLCM